jgi:hypothetical protein
VNYLSVKTIDVSTANPAALSTFPPDILNNPNKLTNIKPHAIFASARFFLMDLGSLQFGLQASLR